MTPRRMGRVDLHNHMLFGIDDGAVDEAETLAMARALVAAGYSDVVTTPHAKPDMDPARTLVHARRAEVQALLESQGIPLKLHDGCENHLTPDFMARVGTDDARTLAGSPYVLVELPFTTPVLGLRDLLFKIQLAKKRVVFAHPERVAQFAGRLDAAEQMFDAGAQFQLEVASLAGLYGPVAKKSAQAMLDAGLVAVVGTDAHHPRSTEEIVGAGLKALAKAVGPTKLQLFTEENPGRILAGRPLTL